MEFDMGFIPARSGEEFSALCRQAPKEMIKSMEDFDEFARRRTSDHMHPLRGVPTENFDEFRRSWCSTVAALPARSLACSSIT
jgi:hypothetical protein